MRNIAKTSLLFSLFIFFAMPIHAQWILLEDESDNRLTITSIPDVDEEEKDVAISDLNRDGWTDVVVTRKLPFSNPGGKEDLLLMNIEGHLTDMTEVYAPDFTTILSDARDLFIGDFDLDGWDDIVIANTFEQQPVFYHNLGEDGDGNWLGLADESKARFPEIEISPLQFCALWAGDINGNGAPDIFFSNYDPEGTALDVLFINLGDGTFRDLGELLLGDLRNSAFGTSCEIYDIDNDGDMDIVKSSTLFDVPPWNDIGIFNLYNNNGRFTTWQKMPSTDPYMFTMGDLNNDGMLDTYVIDDQQDYLNFPTELHPDSTIDYQTNQLQSSPRTTGFGGNVKFADLDNDGDLDVGIADVDVDIPPCETGNSLRKFTMLQNEGLHSGTMSDPWGTDDNVWNESTFDFAFLDIDNDGWLDVFAARCTDYAVYMQRTEVFLATPSIVDFGTIYVGESASESVQIRNNSADTLQVVDVMVSDSAFAVDTTAFELLPGSSMPLDITFSPDTSGAFEAILTLTTDTTHNLTASSELIGEATTPPTMMILADTIFATIVEGDTAFDHFTIYNQGGSELVFSTSVAPPNFWVTIEPDAGSIPGNDSLNLALEVGIAGLPPGQYETEITVSSNDPLMPEHEISVHLNVDELIGINATDEAIPRQFALGQNFPNPFNPSTAISIQLPVHSHISLSIYDSNGQLVNQLANDRFLVAGTHEISWDGTNHFGQLVGSGVYFYRLSAVARRPASTVFNATKKMLLLK